MIRGFSVHIVLKHKKLGLLIHVIIRRCLIRTFPVDIVKNALKKSNVVYLHKNRLAVSIFCVYFGMVTKYRTADAQDIPNGLGYPINIQWYRTIFM